MLVLPPLKTQPVAVKMRWVMRSKTSLMGITVAILWCLILSQKFKQRVCESSSFFSYQPFCSTPLTTPEWNLLYHLGGNGPWIPKVDALGHADDLLPKGCVVDQAHMLSRHGERYPTRSAGSRHLKLVERLQKSDVNLKGSLSFLKKWTYFTNPQNPAFENLTSTGPYAGTTQSRNAGRKLRRRYKHLIHKGQNTRFWSASSPRDVETARYFGKGFFGNNWETDGSAHLFLVPEVPERGGDTLTPGDTCIKYRTDTEFGHDYGYHQLAAWQNEFTPPIAKRLSKDIPSVPLSPSDIYSMMEMCGFETIARGTSPWCHVFTREEWLQYEYGRDLLHFYRAGPGNQYAGAMGWLWLNAVQELMLQNQTSSVFFSFAHDGDIIPLMATLQLYDEHALIQDLPTDQMKEDRQWRTSDVVPMGGRVVFERIACGTTNSAGGVRRYVRVFINDGLVAFPGVSSVNEMEHAIVLQDFDNFVDTRRELFGDFKQVCKLGTDAPGKITFIHQ